MRPPLVTVVTPVYNGEQHLAECIESVLRQTYDNWEFVIVDNGSVDRTPEIAQGFAAADSRIRYERHEEHVNVIASHNRAVRALGPDSAYCKVLGADDWLFPECLARMVEVADAHPSVGVVGGYRLAEKRVDMVGLPYSQTLVSGREVVARHLHRDLTLIASPSSLLYRSDIVRGRDPFYDETFRHADIEATFWSLLRADFGHVHQVVTFSRVPAISENAVSNAVGSDRPEYLRMLIRYGPAVMPEAEFRQLLRRRLCDYALSQSKQRIRPSRWSDTRFRAFHRRAIDLIVEDAAGDRDVRYVTAYLRLLLLGSHPNSETTYPSIEKADASQDQ